MFLFLLISFHVHFFPHNTTNSEWVLIEGVITDEENNEPVPYATVRVQRTSVGTISNEEGRFLLKLERKFEKDSLVISCLGYQTRKISCRKIAGEKRHKITLRKIAIELDQVVVSSLTPSQLIEEAIKRIPENYSQEGATLDGFYRTASRENGKFVRLLEAAVKVKQIGFENGERAVEYVNTRKSKDRRNYRHEETNLLQEAMTFDHVSSRRGFLSKFNRDFWRYELAGFTRLNGDDIYIVKAHLSTNKKLIQHEATLYIEESTYAIVKIDYHYTWTKGQRTSFNDSLFCADQSWKGVFQYNKIPGTKKYYLNYFNFRNKKELSDWKKEKQAELEVYNEFIVQSVKESHKDEINSEKKPDLYQDTSYNREFWSNYSVPIGTSFYQEILADLDPLASLPFKNDSID